MGPHGQNIYKIGKQIAIAVKAGGPDPDNNPHLRSIILNAKRENMPLENVKRAIKTLWVRIRVIIRRLHMRDMVLTE